MKSKPKNPITESILSFLSDMGEMIPEPFETPYAWVKRAGHISPKRYYDTTYKLHRRGVVEITKQNNRRFIKLTQKGQLELLLAKGKIKKPQAWDGKWRIIAFDIPEGAREKRDQFRYLLKQSGFIKLQASVFISPYSLNREALAYLKASKLIDYIRILRVDAMDNDADLRKKFKLPVK